MLLILFRYKRMTYGRKISKESMERVMIALLHAVELELDCSEDPSSPDNVTLWSEPVGPYNMQSMDLGIVIFVESHPFRDARLEGAKEKIGQAVLDADETLSSFVLILPQKDVVSGTFGPHYPHRIISAL